MSSAIPPSPPKTPETIQLFSESTVSGKVEESVSNLKRKMGEGTSDPSKRTKKNFVKISGDEYWAWELKEITDLDTISKKLAEEYNRANPLPISFAEDNPFHAEAIEKNALFCELEALKDLPLEKMVETHPVNLEKTSFEQDPFTYTCLAASTKGRRSDMEDRHNFMQTPAFLSVGLYDGHGGDQVAERAKEEVPKQVLSFLENRQMNRAALWNSLKLGFASFHKNIAEEFKEKSSPGGCTALHMCFTEKEIWTANAGDCAAIFYTPSSRSLEILAKDQKPNQPNIKKGIEKRGGLVGISSPRLGIVSRVNGLISTGRAIGNPDFFELPSTKWAGVSPLTSRPKIIQIASKPGIALLACDGLWDVMTKEQVGAILDRAEQVGLDLEKTVRFLLQKALKKESTDNISILLIRVTSKT